jgi:hypothetical protein
MDDQHSADNDNDDHYSSQIIEEEDLFFDDASIVDDPDSALLFAEAVAQQTFSGPLDDAPPETDSQGTLLHRLAGPSAHKVRIYQSQVCT